ncbi:hypothetical protein Pan216_33580 [Planctomycetes bacterium Pan216]|uniref:Pheromone autoinducer 2 transporter n=1 Tax=Kolteria novifilia TaxID=2527975 RepID=A0A518B688_9BACT|nr:hypothetical protein Pan216_33580 [Planctomycetes bacterium Pan216]
MAEPNQSTDAAVNQQASPEPVVYQDLSPTWRSVPWGKVLIWGTFLLAVYILRNFFFLIFMTFMLSYVIRSVVNAAIKRLSPEEENPWLERGLTLACFFGFFLLIFILGAFMAPTLVDQTQALMGRISRVNPQLEFTRMLNRTVGVYLFHRKYGREGSDEFDAGLQEFKESGKYGKGLYQHFPSLEATLESEFEAQYDSSEMRRLNVAITQGGKVAREFDEWFLEEKAPEIFSKHRNVYLNEWMAQFEGAEAARRLSNLRLKSDFVQRRDEEIRRRILEDIKRDEVTYNELVKEWELDTVHRRLKALRASKGYKEALRNFYEAQREQQPNVYSYTFDTFESLKEAYPKGQAEFRKVLQAQKDLDSKESAEAIQQDFERTAQAELANDWWTSDPTALSLQQHLRTDVNYVFEWMLEWVRQAARYIITVPIELGMALLLSFFITFDMPNLRKGAHRLRSSRIRHIYAEITPGLVAFARLIGRSFQAQGMISSCNAVLTFIGLWILGIDNAFFLSTIVFLFSFVPVIGIILSSVPIALMAVAQPDGSIWLALAAIVWICVIHFIETSMLNPKIVGNMLHLHPVFVIAILAIGERFFGIWGLLLGVPVAVYILRIVILDEPIPGIWEPARGAHAPETEAESSQLEPA